MKTNTPKKKRAGFTLIEIMVVVLIVGLLLGTVGPNIWNALFSSQAKIAENQIRQLHTALDTYRLEMGMKFPDSLDALLEPHPMTGDPFMKSIPLDPWQGDYAYELNADRKPIITSYGADGAPGGEGKDQDISSETINL